MGDAPERIFLQDAGDYARAAAFEVTWCVEPQDDADTEYIRADKVQALVEALQWIALGPSFDETPAETVFAMMRHASDALAALDAKP
jgi:hypothetical protein